MSETLLTAFHTFLGWDTTAMLALNGCHSVFFDQLMWMVTGKWIWIPLYLSLAYVLLRNFPWKVTVFCLVAIALTITLCDQTVSTIIRPLVGRLRPANLDNPVSSMVHIVNGYRGGAFSFPSSHAANSAGLAMFMILLFKRKWFSWFMGLWALLLCYSRVYLGVHYPVDLLVGILIGSAYATLMYLLFGYAAKRYADGYEVNTSDIKQLYVPLWICGLTLAALIVTSAILVQ